MKPPLSCVWLCFLYPLDWWSWALSNIYKYLPAGWRCLPLGDSWPPSSLPCCLSQNSSSWGCQMPLGGSSWGVKVRAACRGAGPKAQPRPWHAGWEMASTSAGARSGDGVEGRVSHEHTMGLPQWGQGACFWRELESQAGEGSLGRPGFPSCLPTTAACVGTSHRWLPPHRWLLHSARYSLSAQFGARIPSPQEGGVWTRNGERTIGSVQM